MPQIISSKDNRDKFSNTKVNAFDCYPAPGCHRKLYASWTGRWCASKEASYHHFCHHISVLGGKFTHCTTLPAVPFLLSHDP
ncbi:hypothetical protein AALO_G00222580 [Alosa alosa]|uniref:Uncharacterized protein n=1 Tax=Alosa alosa TaxID=278164 RepID=A0AAV6FXC0_9TELE|nr:hypothetical protein AALO_G00222580 [Alosa alosa]